MRNLNEYLDSTLLRADATAAQIAALCHEAMEYKFRAVCIPPCYVSLARDILRGSDVRIATVIGFPLGNSATAVKAYEAERAVGDGADEIDMVMNISYFKSGRHIDARDDIREVVSVAAKGGAIVKVIIETCLLDEDEIREACRLVMETGAAFVKTSTGFSTGGAAAEDVRVMKETVGDRLKIKAAGGIRDLAEAGELIDAGADRLGCSAAADVMEEWKES